MNIEDFDIFTQIEKGLSHHKTHVHINWQDISRDQLIVLARARIVDRLILQFKREKKVPKELDINAADFAQPDWLEPTHFEPPQQKSRDQALVDALMSTLSIEEREQLLRQLS